MIMEMESALHLLSPVSEVAPPGSPLADSLRAARRVDLHCHTTFSNERIKYLPGIAFHPLLTPEQTYDLARARGMDFVTITDHDTIDGCLDLLDRRGPLADFVVGEEVSVAFPEDGTIVHVNVYDIDEAEHRELQRLRGSIYELTDYCRRIGKLYVLNHMTWTAQHRVLKTWQIEAMLKHFDVFEGINGTRSYAHNAFAWEATRGHGKTLVGGSDSHTNRVGTTYTLTEGETVPEMLAAIQSGRSAACGAFGTAEKLREDVWFVLQGELERRLNETHSFWKRALTRSVCRAIRLGGPLACFGYNTRQNALVRKFHEALPA